MQSKVFNLMRGNELLGVLRSYEADFPWMNCKFKSTNEFEIVRPLFETELTVLESDDIEKWEESYKPIEKLNLSLLDTDKNEIIENFLLHIQGDEAWFRF